MAGVQVGRAGKIFKLPEKLAARLRSAAEARF
jgi:hypothetical protein